MLSSIKKLEMGKYLLMVFEMDVNADTLYVLIQFTGAFFTRR